jgi:hypothetical protein
MTIYSPTCAPRVLNQPILITALSVALAITNNSYCVVYLTLVWIRTLTVTVVWHQDTLVVVLHAVEVRVVGSADGLLG